MTHKESRSNLWCHRLRV